MGFTDRHMFLLENIDNEVFAKYGTFNVLFISV